MASYDYHHHHSPSSVLSPWLLDSGVDTELPHILQHELENPPTLASSSLVLPSSSSSTSSISSKGASVARVSKRKSKANPKPPITELSASPSNLRDIVHHFTGSHSSKSAPSLFRSSVAWTPTSTQNGGAWTPTSTQHGGAACNPTSCLLMPQPSALSQNDAMIASACIAKSLKTLETISAYLLKPVSTTQVHEQTLNGINMDSEGNMTRVDLLPSNRMRDIDEIVDNLAIRRQAAELEQMLLKGNDKIDNFFSLSCVVLNQIASQCEILQGLIR